MIYLTTITMYLADSSLLLAMVVALTWAIFRLVRGSRELVAWSVTDRTLVRFCWFLVAFVAFCGGAFKALLPVEAHYTLTHGSTQLWDDVASLFMGVLLVVGVWRMVRFFRRA